MIYFKQISIMASLITGSLPVFVITKENIKTPHYWPFVRGIHWWLQDSTYKGPVMQKVFQCQNIIVYPLIHFSGPFY